MKKYQDIISGITLLIVAVGIFISSGYIPRIIVTTLGPDFMPKLVAAGMGILSCLLILTGYRQRKYSGESSANRENKTAFIKRHIDLLTIGLLIFYAACMAFAGFLVSTSLYLFLHISFMGIMKKPRPMIVVLVSIGSSLVIYIIFTRFLYVMLPAGILG
jgi:putative tricarboxylic transport membrane protein